MAIRSSNAERMEIMHSMCKREFQQLQTNLKKFLLESETIMSNDIFKSFPRKETSSSPNSSSTSSPNVFALLAYDRYMSRVAAATNLARKFNLHLQLHNLNKIFSAEVGGGGLVELSPVSHLFEDFLEWHNILKDNEIYHDNINNNGWKSLRCDGEELEDVMGELESNSVIAVAETNGIDKLTTKVMPKITGGEGENYSIARKITFATPESSTMDTWPSCVQLLNLSQFTAGYRFGAFITFIEDVSALSFYACQMRNDLLYELSNMMVNLPKCVRMPPSNVVFGISINNQNILRGVLQTTDDGDNLGVLLIDYGELLPLDYGENDLKFYDLPKIYRDLPAQAMKCVLFGIKRIANANDGSDDDIEYDRDILCKKLRKYEFKEVNFEVARRAGRVLYVHILENREFEKMKEQIKKGEIASTNPFVNSPEDDNEIGRDIQSQQQRVQFGSNTNLVFLAKSRISNISENDIIYIEVLHIARPDCFYAQILKDKDEQLEQFFWATQEVAQAEKLSDSPQVGDLVLAQYAKDEFWYRAKVIGRDDDDEHLYKVLYVDYGNMEKVPLEHMVKCSTVQIMEPFRAIRCRLAGIRDVTDGDVLRFEQAVEMLVVTLLNQRIEVQVVEKCKDKELCVLLLDKEFEETTQTLVNLGYAEEI